MSAGAGRGPLRLLRDNPAFRLLFLASVGSSAGTMLAVIALTVDVYERTGSGTWVAALLVADFLPAVAIGLALGPLVDRLSRRRLMVASDLVRLAAFAALPFAPSAAAIVALAFVVGFATGFFRPAALAALPNLVPARDLARANALFQGAENLTWMLGPVAGGVLLAAWGPSVPYLVDAATFALSAALVARIPDRLLSSERAAGRGHRRDLAEGFAAVRRSPALRTVLVAWTLVMLGNAAVNVAEVFLVRDTFAAGNLALGVVMGATGLGLVAGSFGAAPLLERVPLRRAYPGAIALMGAGFGLAALAPALWVAVPLVLVAGLGNGVAGVCNPLLVQTGAPDRLRGRAFTVVMSVNFAVLGLGLAAAGPLTDAFGARWLWGGAGAVYAAAAGAALLLARGVRAGEPVGAAAAVAATPGL